MSYLLAKFTPPDAIPGKNRYGGRNPFPPGMRDFVWEDWNGKEPSALCMCCEKVTIERDSKYGWSCGHIISVANGGDHDVKNLLPICGSCNSKMGNEYLYEFKARVYPETMDAENMWLLNERMLQIIAARNAGPAGFALLHKI